MTVKYNFVMNQGETFEMSLQLLYTDRRPFNLTNHTVRGMLRNRYEDIDPLVSFTTTVVDAVAGKIRLNLTDEQTAGLDFIKAVYDVEVENTDTGVVTRAIQGYITLSKEVTR